MKNEPLKVGVTGGIGSGKSIICKVFHVLGVPVYNSDDRAKTIMHEDVQLKAAITKNFGIEAYTEDGLVDRQYLANTVFSDSRRLALLNSLVHPAVGKDFSKWVEANAGHGYVLKEAALIFETQSHLALDYTILVTAPEELRIRRVLSRDAHRSTEQILKIIGKQLPDAEKKKMADFIIANDESSMLLPQILELDLKLRNEISKKAQ